MPAFATGVYKCVDLGLFRVEFGEKRVDGGTLIGSRNFTFDKL